jgi:hypothetical protein
MRRLRLEALGKAPVVTAAAERLPPRPFGLRYPAAADQPAPAEVASGKTWERGVGVEVPSIILPPPPGLRAKLNADAVVVDWSSSVCSVIARRGGSSCRSRARAPGVSPHSADVAVHDRSGTVRVRLPAGFPDPSVLRAATESIDGTPSRLVAVLIRRQT